MTVTSVVATQLSNIEAEVVWVSTVSPVLGFEVFREVNAGAAKSLGTVADTLRLFVDPSLTSAGLVVGDSLLYSVVDLDAAVSESAPAIILRDLEAAFTYGSVSYLNTVPRYTTIAAVKQALNITDTSQDTELTTAVVAAETQIDVLNERSFPDTGSNPEIPGVPSTIAVWALDASIAVYKLRDSSAGGFEAGSDAWIGSIDVADEVRRSLRRNPLALGYKVAFGVA